ncbi:MAG TPA: SOS response-associated peptidase [Baekduia sp.]|uniref:SOS response-associated peptidase n=1 Tax=Baekduia sp. TaxID=2600305 RepID=UPI002C2B1ADB|nr:SOS response-associated peptidase [Baekduia sp.]HMJ37549.1 SOS response-associated peptidase [Baekduia sp.]
MCGRYSLATPAQVELRARFGLGESVDIRRRFNVAPGDDILAVTTSKEGEPRGDVLRWGLVPHWAKDPRTGFKLINARSETIAEKPAYRDALKTRRCLIVADGFYEWRKRDDRARKQPFHITRADGAPFAFAGLWAVWHGPGDEVLRTATIVTTGANDLLADIHDRMPVILPDQGAEDAWLDHGTPRAALTDLLAPLPDALTARRPVGLAVSDARYDGPDCLADPEPEPEARSERAGPGDLSLF